MSEPSEYGIFNLNELKYVVNLFELASKTKKGDLITELIDAGYTVDEVKLEIDSWEKNPQKGRLEKLEAKDREIKRLEREREDREREQKFELSKLEAEARVLEARLRGQERDLAQNGANGQSNTSSNSGFNMTKYIQPFKEECDMSLYLTNFERVCTQMGFDKESWAIRLTSVLSPAANEVIARLSEIDCNDYAKVRASLLKKYRLTAEVFRNKFRYGKRKFDQSYAEFAYQLKVNLNEWIKSEEIGNDFEKFVQLICLEKFYNSIPSEMRFWLEDHNKLKSIEEAGDLADVYISKRGPLAKRSSSNNYKTHRNGHYGKGKVDVSTGSQNKTEEKDKTPETSEGTEKRSELNKTTFDKRRPFRCYGCGQVGHMKNSPDCPKVQVVMATVGVNEEAEDLFEPYTLTAEVNNIKTKILRDSAAAYDMAHTDLIKAKDYTGKCVNVRGILSEESVALPVATVTLNCPEFGEIVTEAAVTDKLPVPYLLSNRTWGMLKNSNAMPVFALTRSKTRKILENYKDKVLQKFQLTETLEEKEETEQTTPVDKENDFDIVEKFREGLEPAISIPDTEKTFSDITKLTPATLRILQLEDPSLKQYFEVANSKIKKDKEHFYISHGILHRRFVDKLGRSYEQVVVPERLRPKLVDIAHENMWMGHLGCNKTIKRLKMNYWWGQLGKDVKIKIKYCDVCMRVGKSTDKKKAPMCQVPIITEPYRRVNVDIVGPLPKTDKGNKYLLTMICSATRFPDAVPLQVADSESVVKGLLNLFSRVGFPLEIQMDLGTVFTSNLSTEFLERCGVKIIHSSIYHPQSNAVERFHGVYKRILRTLCFEHGKEWDEYVEPALFALRCAPHCTHGFSPAELCYGRQMRSPLSILKDLWVGEEQNEPVVEYVLRLLERFKNMQEIVEIATKEAQKKSKLYYDRNARKVSYKIGEKVMLYQHSRANKLQMQWAGPKKIAEKISDTNYVIEELGGKRKQTVVHVNLLKPYHDKAEIVAMTICPPGEDGGELEIVGLDLEPDNEILTATEVMRRAKGVGQLDEKRQKQLVDLIEKFPGLFSSKPGRTKLVKHHIKLKEEKIIRSRAYSHSPRVRELIDKELDKMLELKVIRPSNSEYSSPIIIVEAEGKEPRPVVDYRGLNAISEHQQHPVPNIEACVERCSSAKFLSTIDVVRAYWQIEMTEEASRYAAFITHRGLFEPVTLAFGLQSAPASYQRLMDQVLAGIGDYAEPYLDDVAVHSMTWQDHLKHLEEVFRRLYEAGLTLKAEKCSWGQAEVVYLGHVIGQGCRRPSDAKVAAIKEFRRPETKRDVRAFLGITGYYNHYIPNYSDIASPLTDALKKKEPNKIIWDDGKENSFQTLKAQLVGGKILRSPDYEREFIVQTDCSKRGMGVTLSQRDANGEEYPILYLSKKLTEREQAYGASELECGALVWAVNKLKPYLLLTHFTVETDHCPLTWLKQMGGKNGRLLRWSLALQMLNFTIVYKPGKRCGNVDSLSRYFV